MPQSRAKKPRAPAASAMDLPITSVADGRPPKVDILKAGADDGGGLAADEETAAPTKWYVGEMRVRAGKDGYGAGFAKCWKMFQFPTELSSEAINAMTDFDLEKRAWDAVQANRKRICPEGHGSGVNEVGFGGAMEEMEDDKSSSGGLTTASYRFLTPEEDRAQLQNAAARGEPLPSIALKTKKWKTARDNQKVKNYVRPKKVKKATGKRTRLGSGSSTSTGSSSTTASAGSSSGSSTPAGSSSGGGRSRSCSGDYFSASGLDMGMDYGVQLYSASGQDMGMNYDTLDTPGVDHYDMNTPGVDNYDMNTPGVDCDMKTLDYNTPGLDNYGMNMNFEEDIDLAMNNGVADIFSLKDHLLPNGMMNGVVVAESSDGGLEALFDSEEEQEVMTGFVDRLRGLRVWQT